MPARLLRLRRLAWAVSVLSVALTCGVSSASAASQMFVQTAATATATTQGGARYTLTLRGTPTTVLRFDDRPQRLSRRIPLDRYLALWRGPFQRDAPNAVLVGTRDGRSRETVVELLSARRVRGGTRYAVRATDGQPPRRLRNVSLFVDSVGSVTPQAPDLILLPGSPLDLGTGAQPGTQTLVYGNVVFEPGGFLTYTGSLLQIIVGSPAQAAALATLASPPPAYVAGSVLGWEPGQPTTITLQATSKLSLSNVVMQFEVDR